MKWLKFGIGFAILGSLALGFQNCSNEGFTTASSESKTTELSACCDAQPSPAPTVHGVAPTPVSYPVSATPVTTATPPVSSCVSNLSQSCMAQSQQHANGCESGYICADFIGIYYNSPNGCTYDPSSGQSSLEYKFDTTTGSEMSRAFNNNAGSTYNNPWSRLGDASSPYHCTYIGAGGGDAWGSIPVDGQCHLDPKYPEANTYLKVSPGTGCSHSVLVSSPGTIQCDGSCQ